MLKMKKIQFLTLSLVISILSACSTTKTAQDEEDSIRKIRTAKINAQLGIAYLERKNIQRSKQKLLLALKQGPDIPETWYSMGYFLESTGNKDEANKYYLRAIEVAPNRGDAQNNYGTFLCRAGNYSASIQRFLLAVKDPNYLDPAAAYENAGVCAMKIPLYTEAQQYFNQSILQDPARPVSLIKLAEIYYIKGNYQLAQLKLNQFLTISSPTSQSLLLSVRISKKLAQQKEAMNHPRAIDENFLQAKKVKPVLALTSNSTVKEDPLPAQHEKRVVYTYTKRIEKTDTDLAVNEPFNSIPIINAEPSFVKLESQKTEKDLALPPKTAAMKLASANSITKKDHLASIKSIPHPVALMHAKKITHRLSHSDRVAKKKYSSSIKMARAQPAKKTLPLYAKKTNHKLSLNRQMKINYSSSMKLDHKQKVKRLALLNAKNLNKKLASKKNNKRLSSLSKFQQSKTLKRSILQAKQKS